MFTFRIYDYLCGFGSCLFLHFYEVIIELSWFLCSVNYGYFEYVKSDTIVLLLHENLCLVVISWCLSDFGLFEWNSWGCCWILWLWFDFSFGCGGQWEKLVDPDSYSYKVENVYRPPEIEPSNKRDRFPLFSWIKCWRSWMAILYASVSGL